MLKRQNNVFKAFSFKLEKKALQVFFFSPPSVSSALDMRRGKEIIKKKKTYDTLSQMNNKVRKNIPIQQRTEGSVESFFWFDI